LSLKGYSALQPERVGWKEKQETLDRIKKVAGVRFLVSGL